MVTSRISYSLHCDIGHPVVHDLSRLRVDNTKRENTMPALYVAMATWIPKCNLQHNVYNVESDPGTTKTSNPNETTTSPESGASPKNVKDDPTPKIALNSGDTPKKINTSPESATSPRNVKEDPTPKIAPNPGDTPKKILNVTLESETTSKKVLSPAQQKKIDEKMKQKQEREEQRLKERNEKVEQKKKEKEEKEEQRRKEREEKEEQKRKEKEEKEEQKRKEREEKEEQRRKEKEEKDEQKRKEREEKEDQKRKEREERELKKQQEIDEKTREKKKKEELIQKEKAAFVSFFRKSSSAVTEPKKVDEEKSYAFMPFAVKSDMRLAPVIRSSITFKQKEKLVEMIETQPEAVLYLAELKKGKKIGKCTQTWPVEDEDDADVILIEETESDIGERVEEQKTVEKMRAKLLKFHENRRPAYFGTWRKKSKCITARKPYTMDKTIFDYEVESDDDWEEEEPGESLAGSDDDEKENDPDDYEVDNDLFVPHGYLSDEEIEAESQEEVSAETQKEKLKILQLEFDEEMKSKTERIKPRLIGCIWDNKLIPKIEDAIHKFLGDRMMIVTGPIIIPKRDSLQKSPVKPVTPNRKQLSKELIPEFLNLIHGNTRNQNSLAAEFLSYLSTLDIIVAKSCLLSQLKRLAKWKKCPDEGTMRNKFCWYVEENVRTEYNVRLDLPNSWSYTRGKQDENTSSRKKLNI